MPGEEFRISHMLRQKRIDEALIENALSQIDDEEWYEACLDTDLRDKSSKLKEENPFQGKGKLFRYAASHGFEPDLIYRALDQLEKE